ncbi:MAG: phosphate ABC transporter substrate-binding protein [Verrucomicrobia bacterium]|nr:phosphate ABC transporter substrate-binding protein [Verrucomicrobiota bacterium]
MKNVLISIIRGPRKCSLLKLALLPLPLLLITGCPSGKQAGDGAVTNKLVIKGSNTIGEELAPRLIAEFKKEHPKVTIELESKATSYGLANLRYGSCDIAAASRTPTTLEVQENGSQGVELNEYVIGSYAVAVIVNPANPVKNLTKEQVRDVFTGVITNWQAIGGPDKPIRLCIRDAISGTHLGFQDMALENRPYGSSHGLFTNYTAIADAIAKDADCIGYTDIKSATSTSVSAISINGIHPSTETVNKGSYPYHRVLRLYTDKARESQQVKDFISFVIATKGQKNVDQLGFVTRP